MYWKKGKGKWIGQIHDRLRSAEHGKALLKNTKYFSFDEEDACAEAVSELIREENHAFELEISKRASSNPLTKGLQMAPVDVNNALHNTLYWKADGQSKYNPYRAVKVGSKQYQKACDLCSSQATPNVAGGERRFCKKHGGGKVHECVHGKQKTTCRECNPNAIATVACCSVCAKGLYEKRRTTKGGNGLCAACEKHQASEASASGSAPPEAGKRWEDLVLDQLIPKVVDSATGVPFPFEMRDSMSHMLGSSGKRRRGECDTTKQRRPDLLYLVREPERGRIVAALKVGVDEHSHETYEPACESGKIDDQFQALQQLAAKEGAAAGAAARSDAQMVYCMFLKFNPNACDVTPPIRLTNRIEVLAKRCSEFLNTPAEEFQRRSREGEANVPHVECLYYHSVQGKAILEHFETHAEGAWDWRGNVV